MNFRISFWSTSCWMNMETAKITTIIKCFIDGQISEVLVPECHDLSFGYKSSKLIFACRTQFGQLDTSHFGTDRWSKVIRSDILCEEFGITWVCIKSGVMVLKRLKWRIFLIAPSGEIVSVLIA
jgi:hypothetical protein